MAKKINSIAPPENIAVIYARYSTEHQKETSIEAQLRACREYAKRNGLEVAREYIDRAKSGTNMAKREQLIKMISDSGKEDFSKVLVFSIDRFSRNLRDYLNNTHDLKENGVTLRSVTEQIDDSYSGKILAVILMLNAEMYVSNLAQHIKKSQKENAIKGLYVGGTPPLGYFVDSNKEYVVNEKEADIVREIFEMYDSGRSYNDIIGYLNSLGHRTKGGGNFGKNSLYGILKNEKYIGKYSYGGKSDPDSQMDKPIVLENRIPPIIEKELFDRVQLKLEENKAGAGRSRARRNYALSGLIRCGLCKANMHVNTRRENTNSGNTRRKKRTYSSYHCPNVKKKDCKNKKGIRRRFVERFVFGKIFKYLFLPLSLEEVTARLNEYIKIKSEDSDTKIKFEKGVLAKINKRIQNLTDSTAQGNHSMAIIKELKKLEEEQESVEDKILSLKSNSKASQLSQDEVFKLIKEVKQTLIRDNAPECHKFMTSYVKNIWVDERRIAVDLNLGHSDEQREGQNIV